MGPLILIVVDGINEKAELRWPSFFRTLQDGRWRGRVLALATDRPGHWIPECQSLKSYGFARISVKRYDDAELARALSGRGVGIGDIPDGPHQDLIRTPLYCDLVCEHLPEMVAQGDPTVERLLLLDMRYRRSSKPGFPLSEDEFTAIVVAAAERYRAGPERLTVADAARLSPLPDHRRKIYHEIVSGGLLVRKPGAGPPSFIVERKRLVYGLGMLLAEEVRQCAGEGGDAVALRELIEFLVGATPGDRPQGRRARVCALSRLFRRVLSYDGAARAARNLARHSQPISSQPGDLC